VPGRAHVCRCRQSARSPSSWSSIRRRGPILDRHEVHVLGSSERNGRRRMIRSRAPPCGCCSAPAWKGPAPIPVSRSRGCWHAVGHVNPVRQSWSWLRKSTFVPPLLAVHGAIAEGVTEGHQDLAISGITIVPGIPRSGRRCRSVPMCGRVFGRSRVESEVGAPAMPAGGAGGTGRLRDSLMAFGDCARAPGTGGTGVTAAWRCAGCWVSP